MTFMTADLRSTGEMRALRRVESVKVARGKRPPRVHNELTTYGKEKRARSLVAVLSFSAVFINYCFINFNRAHRARVALAEPLS